MLFTLKWNINQRWYDSTMVQQNSNLLQFLLLLKLNLITFILFWFFSSYNRITEIKVNVLCLKYLEHFLLQLRTNLNAVLKLTKAHFYEWTLTSESKQLSQNKFYSHNKENMKYIVTYYTINIKKVFWLDNVLMCEKVTLSNIRDYFSLRHLFLTTFFLSNYITINSVCVHFYNNHPW